MSTPKKLLFPFSIHSPYFEGYAWAIELALHMQARLQLFTAISFGPPVNPSRDSIFHSLLEAKGYYLQHYQTTGTKENEVRAEPLIAEGELKEALLAHLKKQSVDIVILDTAFSSVSKGIQEIVKESESAIILSENKFTPERYPHQALGDRFYDRFREAQLYKLPENFFTTLGNDRSVFNYLRKFFQKK